MKFGIQRIINKLSKLRKKRVVTIKTFIKEGCKFEITSPIEASRVEQFGGEEFFTEMIISELKPSDLLYDIGACVGMVTIHAAKKCSKVVAFEPDPSYRIRLGVNIKLNNLKNVKVVDWAVSDKQGETILYTDGVEGNSPSLCKVGDRGVATIKTDFIDNAINRNEFSSPDVVKLDIEGAEISALKGMKILLASKKAPRVIFIETHPDFLPLFNSSEKEVLDLIELYGYKQSYKSQRKDQLHYVYKRN